MEGEGHTHPCACGETNSVDHSLICKLGSYTSMRRNSVRDSVQIEPTLLDFQSMKTILKVNTADIARLDNCAKGLWNSCEKTFFDIRITHPTSLSYSGL